MWFSELSVAGVALFGLAAFLSAFLALIVFSRIAHSRSQGLHNGAPVADVSFVFNGSDLVDATPAAYRLFDLSQAGSSDWERLQRFLALRFPELLAMSDGLLDGQAVALISSDGLSRLDLDRDQSGLKLRLSDVGHGSNREAFDRQSLAVFFQELRMLRSITGNLSVPLWRQTSGGEVIWANTEYRRLAQKLHGQDANSTNTLLFSDIQDLSAFAKSAKRASLELPEEAEPRAFELWVNPLDQDSIAAALPIDRIVHAERSLNGFIQTLTQTFAHLNVGLAVFNRSRELVIFNPALTDLLDLAPEYLVSRPTLLELFDRLREKRMMPEPKDYKSWRDRVAAFEEATSDVGFSETWSLVDGRTLRVSGRMHPEGAIAILFEDISQEITLERRFRADVQLAQSVIDGVDEAIAVFAPSGQLALDNRAFRELWFSGDQAASENANLIEHSKVWQNRCVPNPVWGDVRDFAATIGERANWTAEARLRDGRALACRFEALAGGYTQVGFTLTGSATPNKTTSQASDDTQHRKSA